MLDYFLQQIANALSAGSLYAMMAVGLALIFSILRLINFAHGDVMMIATYLFVFATAAGIPVLPALALMVGGTILIGLVMERVAYRPLRGGPEVALLLSSFAVGQILQNSALLVSRLAGMPVQISFKTPDLLSGSMALGPLTVPRLNVASFVIGSVLLVLLTLFVTRTRLGLSMQAVAEDLTAARLMGIRVDRVVLVAFAIASGLAAVAGYLYASQAGQVNPFLGFTPVLKAFIATVIGGFGSLTGAVLGAYVLAFLEVIPTTFGGIANILPPGTVSPEVHDLLNQILPGSLGSWRDAFVFVFLILMLLVRPNGLLRGGAREDTPVTIDRRVLTGILLIGVLALALVLLESSGSSFWQGEAILLAIFVVLTVSLNLISGFTGLFSLGHIGFMALGVYVSAILTLSIEKKTALLPDLPDWLGGLSLDQTIGPIPVGWLLATVIAGLLVSLVALAVGAVIMRLSGNFVAVATLGFLVIVRVVLINADGLTRGSRTFSGVTPFTDLWWSWAWAVVAVFVVWRIKRSPWGRQMLAQRADRWAAQAVGIPILRPRLIAFVISAFFAAVAGSLYAHFIPAFSPSTFYFDLTFEVITMLVVGGLASVTGSVVGAVVIVALTEALRRVEDVTQLYGMSGIALGVFFLAIIIFRPEGIMGQRELSLDGLRRLGRRGEPSV